MTPPLRQIRAHYDEESITVYQAYSPIIAEPAVTAGRFVAPFKLDRMTWIKPSFLWMMHRSGWATKTDQERILAIRITRTGFDQALALSCLSHFDPAIYPDRDTWRHLKEQSPVRVQWDPERNVDLQPLPWRTIQIGLSGRAIHDYVSHWTIDISDITDKVIALQRGDSVDIARLPVEQPYYLRAEIAGRIGADANA